MPEAFGIKSEKSPNLGRIKAQYSAQMKHPFCPLCGQPATTREHIIPRWLQSAHGLSNQALGLHNGTILKYHQAIIPLCQTCNGDKLSKLESKIKDGTANQHEYFLWALKIRYFLTLKDITLLFDRRDPSKGKLIHETDAKLGIEFITNALVNYNNPEYNFFPNPFGSVFIFKNPRPPQFAFIDLANPYWGLCITIPDDQILAALFTDRGLVKESMQQSFKSPQKLDSYFQSLFKNSTMEGSRLLMYSLCLRQHRISNIPTIFHLYENGIRSDMPEYILHNESIDKTFAAIMAKRLGFPHDFIFDLINQLS